MMMGQHWLGKTKPKQAFRSTQKAFKKGIGIGGEWEVAW